MTYTIDDIAQIVQGTLIKQSDSTVAQIVIDSRKVIEPTSSIFFALSGLRRDGQQFIPILYEKGVRNFVVNAPVAAEKFPEANFIIVSDTLSALQQLAAQHRMRFSTPVIGITGSNGKTIVKEWLYQLLHIDYNIVRSPKSYNSQIGVPLSVWQMNEQHTLGIFEAGISHPGEMEKLSQIIQPTIGIFTNIGEAHSEGFESLAQKEKEKRLLFANSVMPLPLKVITIKKEKNHSTIVAHTKTESKFSIQIPFTDDAAIHNAITCWELMLHLGYSQDIIAQRMLLLTAVYMRLEMKKGINDCLIINDSYSADTSSLEIALDFLAQQSATAKRTVILSDFLQSNTAPAQLYGQVMDALKRYHVNRLIGIGEQISQFINQLPQNSLQIETYLSTEDFITHSRFSTFKEETILVKGARLFAFERIVKLLEQKAHQTVLEVNLSAIIHNLKEYQQQLSPTTKIMAMVKAFAYGSGGAEIAGILQFHKVDYLGVAYADEGVDLRKAGIHLPIMVMNPEQNAYEAIIENSLEPEMYSLEILETFDAFLKKEGLRNYPIHLEIETGMNRLGFSVSEVESLLQRLQATLSFKVQSVFSHLAASEDETQDEFSKQQYTLFMKAVQQLKHGLGYSFISHISNSAAAIRLPAFQLDMVRLGIGLYGVDSAATGKLNLQTVATLKSTVAQIKYIKKGESVSYNRKAIATKDMTIATIRIGYADGFPRRLGNGIGKIFLQNKLVPIVGTVCMDMFMVDVTDVADVTEGDEVIVFGAALPVQQVASWAGTIPYEIMTGISQRVKRVYFEE